MLMCPTRSRRMRLCTRGILGHDRICLLGFCYAAIVSTAVLFCAHSRWLPNRLYSALFDDTGSTLGDAPDPHRPPLPTGEERMKFQQREKTDWSRLLTDSDGIVSARVVHQELDLSTPMGRAVSRESNRHHVPSGLAKGAAWQLKGNAVGDERARIADEVEVKDGDARQLTTDAIGIATAQYDSTVKLSTLPGYTRVMQDNSVLGEGLRLHCRQCAVVSSSGHLLSTSLGREIDSADCVIRMNSAPTVGYEVDVGSRTTVRVIGHVNMVNLNASWALQREILAEVQSRTDKVVIPWLHTYSRLNSTDSSHYRIARNFAGTYPDVELYLVSRDKTRLAEELFKTETGITTREANTWLSTGWMTLLFATDVCDHIGVYGLPEEHYCRDHPNDSTPYHYYQPDGITECAYYRRSEKRLTGGHLFITEKAVFARWSRRFNLTFHAPRWTQAALNAASTDHRLETPFLKMFYEARRANVTVRRGKVVRRIVKRIVVRRKVPAADKRTKT